MFRLHWSRGENSRNENTTEVMALITSCIPLTGSRPCRTFQPFGNQDSPCADPYAEAYLQLRSGPQWYLSLKTTFNTSETFKPLGGSSAPGNKVSTSGLSNFCEVYRADYTHT